MYHPDAPALIGLQRAVGINIRIRLQGPAEVYYQRTTMDRTAPQPNITLPLPFLT